MTTFTFLRMGITIPPAFVSLFFFLPAVLAASPAVSVDSGNRGSDVNLQTNPWKHQVGISYSMISGHGIHYLTPVNDKWAVKLSFITYYDVDKKENVLVYFDNNTQSFEDIQLTNLYYNLGLEARRYLYTTEKLGVYMNAGSFYSHDRSDFIDGEYGYDWSRQFKDTKLRKHLSMGTGLGIERRFAGVIEVNFDVGYIFRTRTDFSGQSSLNLGTGIGIGYRF